MITINLTQTQDYHGNLILASNLQKGLLYLRQDVSKTRSADQYVTYKIIFFPNTPIYSAGNVMTQANDYFTVSINAKSIYPTQIGQNTFKIILTRNGQNQNIDFSPNYTSKYCVVEAIGILVAQQMRFNTLDLVVTAKQTFTNSLELFTFMTKNYLDKVYKNWKNSTLDPKILPPQVKVVIPWLP